MTKLTLPILLSILTFQSCSLRYPSSPLLPRAPYPIAQSTRTSNPNTLPNKPNFVQAYSKNEKITPNSRFGALVRSIEFEYDIGDTFKIITRVTSGYDEGEMNGLLHIILDKYELTYENKTVEVREYVEEISFDSDDSDMSQSKINRKSQLYNSVKFQIENDDIFLLKNSKELAYIIEFKNSKIKIYPTKEQIKVLSKMLDKYHSD